MHNHINYKDQIQSLLQHLDPITVQDIEKTVQRKPIIMQRGKASASVSVPRKNGRQTEIFKESRNTSVSLKPEMI